MTAPPWGDPFVGATLGTLIDNLGRRTAFDPARLRAALNDDLGSRAHQHRAEADALVLAAEEEIPQGLLAGAGPDSLAARLTVLGLRTDAAAWVVDTWATALRVGRAEGGDRTELPPEPAQPQAGDVTELPPGRVLSDAPEEAPAPTRAGASAGAGAGAGAGVGNVPRRRLLVILAAGVLAVVTVVGVVLALRGGRAADPDRPLTGSVVASDDAEGPASSAPPSSRPRVVDRATPLAPLRVLAHEGGDEKFAPETAQSLVNAARTGAAAETDVRWTSDDVAVLLHDKLVTAPMTCTGGRQPVVADTSLATLQAECSSDPSASTNGKRYPIPTFAEAAQRIAAVPGAQLFAEVKQVQTPRQVRTFMSILKRNDLLERTVVTSFKPQELAKIRTAASGSGGVRLMQFATNEDLAASAAKKAGLWAVAVRDAELTGPYVEALHAAGVEVVVWTVNDTAQWARARSLGVDHVLTDRPGAYRAWQRTR